MSPDELGPEQRLRRLQDPDRWEDATLTPRSIESRRLVVLRFVGATAVLVASAGVLVGVVALGMHSGGTSSLGAAASAMPSSRSSGESNDDWSQGSSLGVADQGAPVPFASLAPSSTFQSSGGERSASALRASIAGPSTVVAGTDLRVVVTLRNPGTTAVDLDTCPAYRQTVTIGTVHVSQYFRLNCGPVPQIPAGGSVAFAMRIPIPESASGTGVYAWALDGGPTSTLSVTVATQ